MGTETARLFFKVIEKGKKFNEQIILSTELVVQESSVRSK
jgi:DNA-binding LacI/PurR family transcriptional regulator